MAKYVFPAIFTSEEGGKFSVDFPDLDGCYTCGDDLGDAIVMAEDVLAFYLFDEEKAGHVIPEPSNMESIPLSAGEFVNYITCDTIVYARMHDKKSVRKTVTIPGWLNEAAKKKNINFSQVLQQALMYEIGEVGESAAYFK